MKFIKDISDENAYGGSKPSRPTISYEEENRYDGLKPSRPTISDEEENTYGGSKPIMFKLNHYFLHFLTFEIADLGE